MNKLGTKAETLRKLYQKLKHAEVLPQYTFTVGEWETDPEQVEKKFLLLGWNNEVIVRSSSLAEDTSSNSQAGKYESIASVSGVEEFRKAVETVIDSYDDDSKDNQVLVQPMLADVSICGVAFTLDPNTMGNYYVINYDDKGSTSAITSGNGTANKLYYKFKQEICRQVLAEEKEGQVPNSAHPVSASGKRIEQLCLALQELENFFGQNNLDVEFAFTETNELYILQVRALCIQGEPADREQQEKQLRRIRETIRQAQKKKPFLCGEKALYSVMTDWNPAEMIGIRPKPLALSLYREIITDSVWAYQRDNYGYRNLRSFPLMVDFGGLPYIDVRVSFNSFIPAELEEELSDKLVNYYLDRLIENPAKHDKAEFDIVFSCYTFDLPQRIQILKDYGFSEGEVNKIVAALRDVTNNIIDHKSGLWRKDYGKIHILNKRYEEIMTSDFNKIEKVYWLLEDCKRYGTLPFAGLARAAFIAVQMLRSLVTCGILSKADYESFMSGVNSVSSDMNHDFAELSRKAFLKKYGHLRPGTYDITSLRYDEAPELYFERSSKSVRNMADLFAKENAEYEGEKAEGEHKGKEDFRLSLQQLSLLKKQLCENGLTNDILELLDFIKTVIEGREYGKFAFTRNLSMALRLIGEIGQEQGISKEDCAFLHIHDIYELYASARDVRTGFLHSIERGKCDYEVTRSITLPPMIISSEDVLQFYYPDSEPNYITSQRTAGEVYILEAANGAGDLRDKIVLIPSADPGYDWIFSHQIKGFITMFGGANSHMAIRAGELSIPAVVGVGGKTFERFRNAQMLEIDAGGKLVRVLK
ncbi:MAG: phosphoenolpyruvate synthase [Lachnospiraceae bacterium]|nr:phosphoenolpyruvate synthase [Lachnospiraceae bacterium]